ncbi:MAG: hypothetical protein HRU29_04550 [Rhizobiales bacterium]|nr:ABC transporter substrate-binding protein [Hyphomicrobiales bacterium]NRB13653.1 hypothetical protein [Hyphomicrobiales bacterium]
MPTDVSVVRPSQFIGEYSATPLKLLGTNGGAGIESQFTESMNQGLFTTDPGYSKFVANVAKGWDLAEDGKSLTIYFREGMKWSDGDDFTANDIVFWHKEVLQNEDLGFPVPERYSPGGELMGLEKIDDYTVKFTFSIPYFRSIEVFARDEDILIAPEHFIKRYMPSYSDGAEALAKSEGYGSWQLAVQAHANTTAQMGFTKDPLLPTLNPWVLEDISSTSSLWVRNPFYWRVDTSGNQLPYADSLLIQLTDKRETTGPIKTLAGELDFTDYTGLALTDYPVLKAGEAKGGYTVSLWPRADQSHAMGFALNYTHSDPYTNKIFNDVKFRQALSLGLDRDEISENVFFGLVEPYTAPMSPLWSGYEDWMGTYFAEHDVERANKLLDEMGIAWDANNTWRIRPDGERIIITGTWATEWLPYSQDVFDLMSLQWKDIGIDFQSKFVEEAALQTLFVANQTDVGLSNSDGGSEFLARGDYPIRLMPPWHWGDADCCAMAAYEWRTWLDSDGDTGIEPPADVKRIYELVTLWQNEPYGTEDYVAYINEILNINVKNLYYVGTVSSPPAVYAVSNNLMNAPREGVFGPWGEVPYMLDTWYVKE